MSSLLWLGLGNWIATLIVTDSELFRPLRSWVTILHRESMLIDHYGGPNKVRSYLWRQARYLVGCPLCVGTWIALAQTLVLVHPLVGTGAIGLGLTALAIKGAGHLTLEVAAALKKVSA